MGNDGHANNSAHRAPMNATPLFPTTAFASPREEYVCWSRMQAEAGQGLTTIVARKENERKAGDGIFFWGVGNAPSAITNVLARTHQPVRAIFSVMKSRPKSIDSAPSRVVAWRRYIDANGVEQDLPPHALVTSRADSSSGPKKVHYALMCKSAEPLELRCDGEPFDPSAFRNAGGTGAPVGNSQVTALLKRVGSEGANSDYQVNLSAWLAGGYWVRLTDPIEITPDKAALLAQLNQGNLPDWAALVDSVRRGPRFEPASSDEAMLF
ncbi:hypothetical protein [Phenylobacterium sp.]|uniref:hypothetical protein n=1 Tax=Phenylobacterium sp. TaxID=1871053 RepID=UPI002732DE6D|nr:hypothetical protein [Phenylobacterium sp.]MDP3634926.1 hypothetical protein [Phenylobacterium sp.]